MLKKASRTTKISKMEEVVPIKEKIVEKLIIVNSQAVTYAGSSYSIVADEKTGRIYNFAIYGSPTGCGLGIFSGFAGWNAKVMKEVDYDNIKKIIKTKCIPIHGVYNNAAGWYCVIATLGDTFVSSHKEILEKLGFVMIHSYNNKNHSGQYQQSVWQLDTTKL